MSWRPITEIERQIIRKYYTETPAHVFSLAALSKTLGRTRQLVCRTAGQMQLTNPARPPSDAHRQATSEGLKGVWQVKPHPRGALGMRHTEQAKQVIGEKARVSWEHMKATGTGCMSPEQLQARSDRATYRPRSPETQYSRAASGFREDIGIYVRSRWEANYARYLNWLKARGEIEGWRYEPQTFWFEKIKRGTRSYTPDFEITENGKTYFVEVKGWMDAKSKTRLKRMAKYYPAVEIRLVAKTEYAAIAKSVGALIPNWETATDKPTGSPALAQRRF